MILNKPIKVINIRKGRQDGGLKHQHLTGIVLLGEVCNAELKGAEIKSTEIFFTPNKLQPGNYMADTKTAGSLTLLLQNVVPPLLFGKESSALHLRGGTNVSFSPQIEEFQELFIPLVERHFGIKLECQVLKKGYYPQGGGEVFVKINPVVSSLKAISLTDFGELKRVYGRAFVAGSLPIKIAQRMASTAEDELRKKFKNQITDIKIDAIKEPDHVARATATGIVLFAETTTGCLLSSSGLGKVYFQKLYVKSFSSK